MRVAGVVVGLLFLAVHVGCFTHVHPKSDTSYQMVWPESYEPRDTLLAEGSPPELPPNYPLCYSPSTIYLNFRHAGDAVVRIYALDGKWLRTLCSTYVANPGAYHINWSLTDASGDSVKSGIYWIQVAVDDTTFTRKMIFMR